MNRMRWLVTGLCIVSAAASAWSLNWFSGKLYSQDDPGELAYRPDDMPPRMDLASVQRDWPASLGGAGDGSRLIAYRHDMQGKMPVPSAGSGPAAKAAPPPDLGALLASANPAEGKAKLQLCASCHDFTQGGPNRIGPNLWGVVGRGVATHPGFAYSPAMQAHRGSWTYDKLFAFLASPGRDVPGTKMTFAGLRRPEDRAAVIKYLATLGSDAPALPQPKKVAALSAGGQ